jgi:hypothetical protein
MKGKARSESQVKVYEIMVVPTAIYGSETWFMGRNCEKRIQTAEMKFLHVCVQITSAVQG